MTRPVKSCPLGHLRTPNGCTTRSGVTTNQYWHNSSSNSIRRITPMVAMPTAFLCNGVRNSASRILADPIGRNLFCVLPSRGTHRHVFGNPVVFRETVDNCPHLRSIEAGGLVRFPDVQSAAQATSRSLQVLL